MFIFLPERVYEQVKDEQNFITLTSELVQYIDIDNISFEEYHIKTATWHDTDIPERYVAFVKSKVAQEYQREIDIMADKNEVSLLSRLEAETDVENILMIYYHLMEEVYITNVIKHTEFRNKYIELVEQQTNKEFSTRVWVKYFQYKAKAEVDRYSFENLSEDELITLFKEYVAYLDTLITVVPKSNMVYTANILKHKKLDEIHSMLKTVLLKRNQMDNLTLFFDCVMQNVNAVKFKFELFNLYTLRIMREIFFHYFFVRDFENCKKYLTKITEYISWAFNNKKYSIKSLTHHNLRLISNFMQEVGFFSTLLAHLPDFPVNNLEQYPTNDKFCEFNKEALENFNTFSKE
jgi:hypothetical protein